MRLCQKHGHRYVTGCVACASDIKTLSAATPPAPQRLAQGDSAVALEVYLSTTWGSAAMRIEALATWLDQQEENCGLLSIAAADLRAMSAKLYSEPTGEGDSWFADALTSMGEVIPLPTQPLHQDRGEVSDAMVDAYLAAQAKAVQAVDDKWGNGGKAASYLHPTREACRAGLAAALATAPQVEAKRQTGEGDTAAMDWLEQHLVEVREPLRYGSSHLFYALQVNDEGEPYRSDLRTRVAAQIAAAAKPSGEDKTNG